MKLNKLTSVFINAILKEYSLNENSELDEKLLKLFEEFSDHRNKSDVLIKVAALNKIYSTAITNINPVVAKINEIAQNQELNTIVDYVNFVDKISVVKWVNDKGDEYERNNLSFASKYAHFSSNYKIPIYDSYIWIVIKGYLGQNNHEKLSFTIPGNYAGFYSTFNRFKEVFQLENYSNYKIDKFLWTYGKKMIRGIQKENNVNLDSAKSELKKRIKASC